MSYPTATEAAAILRNTAAMQRWMAQVGAGIDLGLGTSLPLPIADGGTGQTTAQAAINALLADVTKGNLYAGDGTNVSPLGVGTDGKVLTADSGATTGLIWATPAGGSGTSATPIGDADYTILTTDYFLYVFEPLSATRTLTLPSAAACEPGQTIYMADQVGGLDFESNFVYSVVPDGTDVLNDDLGGLIWFTGSAVYQTDGIDTWTRIGQDFLHVSNNLSEIVGAGRQSARAAIKVTNGRLVISGDATATVDDNFILMSGTGIETLTLPAIATVNPGHQFFVLNAGAGFFVIEGDGSETVNGVASFTLRPGGLIQLFAATAITTDWTAGCPPIPALAGYVWTSNGDSESPSWEPVVTTLADGDYGDITVSGTGTVLTVDNDAVTYAKMQNVSATARVLGRITSGAGDIEELTAANIKTILGTLTVPDGGTGATTLTNHGVLLGQDTSAVVATSAGTTGQVLTSGGASADPSFQTPKNSLVIADPSKSVSYAVSAAAVSMLNGGTVALPTPVAGETITVECAGEITVNASRTVTWSIIVAGQTVTWTTGAHGSSALSYPFKWRVTLTHKTISGTVGVINCQVDYLGSGPIASGTIDFIVATKSLTGCPQLTSCVNNAAYTLDVQAAGSATTTTFTLDCTHGGIFVTRFVP